MAVTKPQKNTYTHMKEGMFLNKSDEDLMVLYQNGNEDAFLVLYERHAKKVFGYIKSKVRNEELSGDIFQEVFVKIHKSKHLYNKSFPLLPWIFTVTRTTLVDVLRKNKKSDVESNLDYDIAVTEENNNIDISPYLSKLPPVQKTALEMRFLEEKTFEEIASLLKTSSPNVRQIISRGMKRVKQMIGDSRE